jgi:putative transposase
MTTDTANVLVGEGWRDGLEAGVRGRIRGFIEELLEEELTAALGRSRYARARTPEHLPSSGGESAAGDVVLPLDGHRNGHRDRQVMGTFGATTVSVPRARADAADGKTSEWHVKTLPAYQHRTK